MPNYQVVCCAGDSCAKFQSQQEKKSNKWSCVVCGLKQSLRRVYFQSVKPKECRAAVMDLNMSRGQLEQNKEQHTHAASQRDLADAHISSKKSKVVIDGDGSSTVVGSKWSEYSEEASDNEAHPNGEDHRVDKHNRIVIEDSNISVPTECQPAKRPRHRAPSALHAPRRKVSNNTNTHAEHSKLHIPSDFAVSSTDSEGALSQALALVRRQNQSVRSITAASTPLSCTIGTATANISKGQSSVVKSPSPSRWDSYVSEPDSGSDD